MSLKLEGDVPIAQRATMAAAEQVRASASEVQIASEDWHIWPIYYNLIQAASEDAGGL